MYISFSQINRDSTCGARGKDPLYCQQKKGTKSKYNRKKQILLIRAEHIEKTCVINWRDNN